MEGYVVDDCVAGCGGDGVEELEEEGDEARFTAASAPADGDFFA
jgi:hypothetical protein